MFDVVRKELRDKNLTFADVAMELGTTHRVVREVAHRLAGRDARRYGKLTLTIGRKLAELTSPDYFPCLRGNQHARNKRTKEET